MKTDFQFVIKKEKEMAVYRHIMADLHCQYAHIIGTPLTSFSDYLTNWLKLTTQGRTFAMISKD